MESIAALIVAYWIAFSFWSFLVPVGSNDFNMIIMKTI